MQTADCIESHKCKKLLRKTEKLRKFQLASRIQCQWAISIISKQHKRTLWVNCVEDKREGRGSWVNKACFIIYSYVNNMLLVFASKRARKAFLIWKYYNFKFYTFAYHKRAGSVCQLLLSQTDWALRLSWIHHYRRKLPTFWFLAWNFRTFDNCSENFRPWMMNSLEIKSLV